MNKIINSLRYLKAEAEGNIDSFKVIDIEDYKEVYCNDDGYIITNNNGDIEYYINTNDERSENEINQKLKNNKKLVLK